MLNIPSTLAAGAVSLCILGTASAATVTLTNADFESTAAVGGNQPIDGWMENDPGSDANYAIANAGFANSHVPTKDSIAASGIYGAVKGSAGAWIGQMLTTSNSGAMDATTFSEFTIDFQLGTRSDANQYGLLAGNLTNIRFSLWNMTTNTELDGETLIVPDPGAAGVALTSHSVSLNYDNSAQTAGDTLQFRITNIAPELGASWQRTSIVDDFSITAIPEPSSSLFAGLALAGVLLRRRR